MRTIILFYAWQSDIPSKINKDFIRIALDSAQERINADTSLGVKLKIDSDTQGVPGTPPISETILDKIRRCEIFFPDVTFVAKTEEGKLVPNPNVMVEYGYALRAKTVSAMMPIMNTAFGRPDQLPFDMRHLRHPIQYCVETTVPDGQRRAERNALSNKIESLLRQQIATTQPSLPTPPEFPKAEAKDGGEWRFIANNPRHILALAPVRVICSPAGDGSQDRECHVILITWHSALMPNSADPIIRCPYCTVGNEFRPMATRIEGWLQCENCGHNAMPLDAEFRCTCSKCAASQSPALPDSL